MTFTSAIDFNEKFPFQGSVDEQILFLLEAATRAPSTHNSQPWRFELNGDCLSVYRDTRIKLPQSDPVNRYAYISIGFLLHHIVSLGDWLLMSPQVTLSDSDENEKVAEVLFVRTSNTRDIVPVIEAIFKRRNRRGNFELKTIPEPVLDAALQFGKSAIKAPEVRVISDKKAIMHIAELTAAVMRRVYARRLFRREMSRWITPTGSVRRDGIPGYSLNQSSVMSWIVPTVIRFVNMGAILGKLNNTAISSAPAAFGFGAPDEPQGWVSVGFAASHAVLTIVAAGFDYSVFVASTEYEDTRTAAGEVFGLRQPFEFLFVAGKLPGTVAWMTPRVSVADKLMPV